MLSSVMLGIICSFLGCFNRGNIRSRAKTQINKMSVDDIQEMLRDISLFDW
jgi:hypothetical protein